MDQATLSQVNAEISRLTSLRASLRREERGLNQRESALLSQPVVTKGPDLRDNLSKILPVHMMPGNVGGYNTVMWPFHYKMAFDFGTAPTLDSNTFQQTQVQVSQEAAFLLLAISRSENDNTISGGLGPYTVEIRDQQSSRLLNDRPIPIQMIGRHSRPTILPTAFLLMPTAFIQLTMRTWLAPGASMATAGESKHEFMLFGYRIRIEDFEKVLSTVFAVK